MRRSAWLVLVLGGCESTVDVKDTGSAGIDEVPESLAFTLDASASNAGDAVGYTLEAVYAGDVREPVEGDITSDLEAALAADDAAITATVAGAHTLTAAAEIGGESFTATAALDVAAGPLAELTLTFDPGEVAPDESATASILAADAYGNALDGSSATLDSQDLTVDGWSVSGTVAGSWTVTATLDEVTDDATLVVIPGDAAALELSLDPTTGLDPGDSSVATVVVTDTWGNVTDDAWTLSAEGGTATVTDDTITFDGEGAFTVTATSGAVSDSVGPIWVDESGPTLVVDAPTRGGWAQGAVTVTGTATDDVSGVTSVTVDGTAATVDGAGAFTADVALDFGLNVLETSATDGDGNSVSDVRAVLSGSVLPWGDAETDGLVVRLHEGEGGLDALTDGVGDLVDPADALDALPSPLYEDESSTCYTFLGNTYCTTYAFEFVVTDLTWASTDVALDPQADGTILLTFTITDPSADWSATGEVASTNYSETGTATADSLVVTAEITLSIVGDTIVAEVGDTSTTLTNLDLDLPSWADSALTVLGYDLETDVEDQLNSAVAELVADTVPDAIADAMGGLTVSEELTVGDATATLTATPAAIDVDDTGVTLSMATLLSLDSWVLGRTAEGSLEYGYAQPTWTGTPGALIGFSADFLNQLFFAAWGGGALSMEVTDEDLGVDMSVITLLLPGLTDLVVVVDPLLPPVAVPTPSGSSPFDLQTGDLLVSMYDGSTRGAVVYQMYVSMVSPMDVAISGDALTTTIGTPTAWVDVVTAPDGTDIANLEGALELLAPSLLGSGISSLADVPLPDLAGYTLTGATASTGGAESGYVVVGGDLTD